MQSADNIVTVHIERHHEALKLLNELSLLLGTLPLAFARSYPALTELRGLLIEATMPKPAEAG